VCTVLRTGSQGIYAESIKVIRLDTDPRSGGLAISHIYGEEMGLTSFRRPIYLIIALNLALFFSKLTIHPIPCLNATPGPVNGADPSVICKADSEAGIISRRGGSNAEAG